MNRLVIAVVWVLVGVLLWMRAMRIYGRANWFDISGDGSCFGPAPTDCPPNWRLAFHVIFAPLFVGAVIWYNLVWKTLVRIGDAATRFAEWYAPASDEEAES